MSILKISISPFTVAGSLSNSSNILPTAKCPFKGTLCSAYPCSFFTAISKEEQLKKYVIGSCTASVSLRITKNKAYLSIVDLGPFRKPMPKKCVCPIIQKECIKSRCVRFKSSPSIPDQFGATKSVGQCMALQDARLQLDHFGAMP